MWRETSIFEGLTRQNPIFHQPKRQNSSRNPTRRSFKKKKRKKNTQPPSSSGAEDREKAVRRRPPDDLKKYHELNKMTPCSLPLCLSSVLRGIFCKLTTAPAVYLYRSSCSRKHCHVSTPSTSRNERKRPKGYAIQPGDNIKKERERENNRRRRL